MPTPPSLEHVISDALKPQYGNRGAEALFTRWWNAMRRRPRHRMRANDRKYWAAQKLLAEAVFYVDADRSELTGTGLKNLGTGGAALNAKFGSTTPSAYFNGTAMVLPGSNSNYANTPSAAALDITGDIEIVVRVAADDWTPAATQIIMSKRSVADLSWQLSLDPAGTVSWSFNNGTALFVDGTLTAPSPLTNGTAYWLKFTRVASTGVIALQQAPDQVTEPTTWPTTWTPSGTRSTGNIAAKAVELAVGASRGGTVSDCFAGKVYRAIVRNGIGGTTVFDADFAKPFDTTSFTATTGQTVTLNRSTSGTDTNDPTRLRHTGTNYLYTPGTATTNGASTPDAAALDITGDLEMEVVWEVAPDWTVNGTGGVIIGKEAAANRSYSLCHATASKRLELVWTVDGSTALLGTSSADVPTDTNAVKVTHDVDNGAGGNTVTIYTSANRGLSYSVLGTPVVIAGTTSHFSGTAELSVGTGASRGPGPASGYRRAIVRNGIGGTTVFDADFTTGITSGGQTTFTCRTGQTVTINRATSGRKAVAVTRPVVLLGTDDYFEVADNALLNFGLTDNFTAVAVIRQFGTPVANVPVLGKVNFALLPGGAGWQLYNNGTTTGAKMLVSDTTAFATAQSSVFPASGALNVMTGVRDVAADLLRTYNNGTASGTNTDVTTATSSNTLPLRVGYGTGTGFNDFEFVAAAVFRRALTAAEISNIVNYYNTVT